MTDPTSADQTTIELPRKFLPDFLLLSLQAFGRSYGYELCQSVQAKGLSADLAAVYRGLRALQRRGLVASSWEPSDSGPDRRVYVLTVSGRTAADAAAAGLSRIRDGLTEALREFESAADPVGG
jgi:PadR family transcriptional regulator PadR